MAILGFLVHTLPEESELVEAEIKSWPKLTTYGVHQDCYVVAVAEGKSEEMEGILEKARQIEGVLTCYVTSMSTEDEEE